MRIRRFLHLAIIAFGISYISVAQNASHTFVVDGELVGGGRLIEKTGKEIAYNWMENEKTGELVAKSWGDEKMYFSRHAVFFDCLVEAFNNHHSVILSPDIIWAVISQGFNHYVNMAPETMRDKIVNHDRKMSLETKSKYLLHSPEVEWDKIFNDFNEQIKTNTKGNIADMMRADFSTTGKTERIASQITLMSTVKSYFDFTIIVGLCGIPSITIEGTPDDWKKVIQKTENLRNYDLDWWVDDLIPILNEFVAAVNDTPNISFWKNIVIKDRPKEFQEGGCSSLGITQVDGWFLKLMPFNKYGRTPEKVDFNTDDMLPNMVCADFKYKIVDATDKVISETPLEMMAGIIGVDVDTIANTMRPKIGWMICESENKNDLFIDKMNERLYYSQWLSLTIGKVPEVLKEIGYQKIVELTFKGDTDIPDWMRELRFDRLRLIGNFSEEQIARIKNLFHNRNISIEERKEEKTIEIEALTTLAPDNQAYTSNMLSKGDKIPSFVNYKNKSFGTYIKENRRIEISDNNLFVPKKRDPMTGIFVEFTIEKDGTITDVNIHKNRNFKQECYNEVERLIKEMPAWNPAQKRTEDKEHGVSLHPIRYRFQHYIAF